MKEQLEAPCVSVGMTSLRRRKHDKMKLEEFLEMDLKKKFGKSKHEAWHEANEKLEKGVMDEELWRIKDLYVIQEILRGTDASLGRLLDEPCPKCGKREVYSGHIDLGGVDYYDNFWRLCLNCLDAHHTEEYTGIGQE